MKRYVLYGLAVVSVVTAIVLTVTKPWQADSEQTTPKPQTTQVGDPGTIDPDVERYLNAAYQLVPEFQDEPINDVVELGKTICDSERTDAELLQSITYFGIPRPEARSFVVISQKTFCPKQYKEGR